GGHMSAPVRRRRTGPAGTTLREVARQAGVSQITASRAVRQPDQVAPATLARVRAAMDALGYQANAIASGLASGRSPVVPVVIPTLTHPVYVPVLRGINEVLEPHGRQVMLGTSEYDPAAEERLLTAMLGWAPAGLMLAGMDHLPGARLRLQRAAQAGTTVIELMDLDGEPVDLAVGISHRQVGRAAAEWFAARGFRHVAYLGAMAGLDLRSQRRRQGFAAALRARGLADDALAVSDEPFSLALGGRLLAQLLDRQPQVQAVFCANDELAAGALFEARRRGLRVPEDLALMGFNDTEIATVVEPAISSIAVDRYGMGRIAAELLLERLGGGAPGPRTIDRGFSIIERATTGAPPRRPEASP
ncbi:MAG: LacI family DNA-binding transcriptional regulator, partial [Pseudoxanthomonas sp.]